MAQQPLTPFPNTPLIPGDPRADFMWRTALGQIFTRVYASTQIAHNSLDGLQGGSAGEYYHLTSSQVASVTSFFSGGLAANSVLYTNSGGTVSTQAGLSYTEGTSSLSAGNVNVTASTRPTHGIYLNEGSTLAFAVGGARAGVVTGANKLLMWGAASTIPAGIATAGMVLIASNVTQGLSLMSYDTDNAPPRVDFYKIDGTNVTSFAGVDNGEFLGSINFRGANGSAFGNGAEIRSMVVTGWTVTSTPARLEFRATAVSTTALSTQFVLETDGRIYGNSLHNNSGSLTGTANQYIASGTYTPTASSISNVSSTITTFQAQWIRVGNVVTVSGRVQWHPTAGATLTRIGLAPPIASNFAAVEDCAGVGSAPGIAGQVVAIQAEPTNDQAEFRYISGDTTPQPHAYSYTYEVL